MVVFVVELVVLVVVIMVWAGVEMVVVTVMVWTALEVMAGIMRWFLQW